MSRPKKRTGEPAKVSSLLSAAKFCQLVTKDIGAPFETHTLIQANSITAFNGVLACGHKIEEELTAAPNNELLVSALSKCGEGFSITQLENNRLSIKSGKFRALVPCIDLNLLTPAIPDPPLAIIDDRFKAAMDAVSVLPSEGAQTVVAASILMAGASLIATDAKVMIEFWTSLDLPMGIALPKAFGVALSKVTKRLAKFGFSKSSATFYFDDDSWLRSQFFAEPWPDVRNILDRKCNAWPVPNDFWKALDAVEPFSEHGDVFFKNGLLCSHKDDGEGASHECFGIPEGPVFSAKQLNTIRPYAKMIDFQAPGVHDSTSMLMFFGDQCRGAIAGRSK